jgi:hypothetical protein
MTEELTYIKIVIYTYTAYIYIYIYIYIYKEYSCRNIGVRRKRENYGGKDKL